MATPDLWQSPPQTAVSPSRWAGGETRDRTAVAPQVVEHGAASGLRLQGASSNAFGLSSSALLVKRVLDLFFSLAALLVVSPVLLAIAFAIKLDSAGPILYTSDRVGKNGRVFRCFKFRTMVRDAEARLAAVLHMNERDAVLFKVSNDPRVTRLGRMLRKYSLDELPQFLNVLRGEMSVVGPRPAVASEVREYGRGHLERLAVKPGITGLWQVQGRHDPSFESYVSLDLTYIENWSVWLDVKIVSRTVGIVLSGTGT
jgi:exopolysaccharide biosynthesis polyprenyl glycosylphosphotransferase